jgi:hypothetical protein
MKGDCSENNQYSKMSFEINACLPSAEAWSNHAWTNLLLAHLLLLLLSIVPGWLRLLERSADT